MRVSLSKTFDATPEQGSRLVAAAAFGMLAVMCLLVTALFWFIERGLSADAQLLAAEGTEAEAVVLDRRIVETRNTDRDGHTTTSVDHFLQLEFVTAAGDKVVVEPSVGVDRYNSSPGGTRLTLRYAPSDPRVIEFEAGERAAEAGLLGWVWRVTGGLTGLFLLLALWKLRRPAAVL